MKETIMDKSIELFAEKGFKETSIQDIMDELHVTKGTFYYYFKSKEELLKDIHLQYIERLLENQKKIISDPSKTCQEKLFAIIYKLIQDIEKEGQRAKVFIREINHLSDQYLDIVLPKRDQFRENVQLLIEEGIKNGEFRTDLPPDIVSFGILGIANWSYFWFKPTGKVSDKRVAEIFYEMLIHGIQQNN